MIWPRDLPNVPCSAEHSAECSLIFGQFGVPLFKGGRGKVKRKVYFLQFSEFFFNFRPFSDSESFKIVAIRSTDALFTILMLIGDLFKNQKLLLQMQLQEKLPII